MDISKRVGSMQFSPIRRFNKYGFEAEANGKSFLTVQDNHTLIRPGDTLRLPVNRWCVHVFDALSEKALCKSVYKEVRHE